MKEMLGDLILAFEDLDASAARHDRAKTAAVYDIVRSRCESCHETFRWAGKKHK